jgi:hypothetical protein
MNNTKPVHSAISQAEEDELIASSERGEWVSVGNIEEQREYFKRLARNTLARIGDSDKQQK